MAGNAATKVTRMLNAPADARESLKPPAPKVLPRPRSHTASGSGMPGIAKNVLKSISKHGDANHEWQAKALDYHDQVVQQVERLTQTVGDEATVKKTRNTLKQARISQGNRSKVTPENFWMKAESVMAILQRIELQQPPVLQLPPT